VTGGAPKVDTPKTTDKPADTGAGEPASTDAKDKVSSGAPAVKPTTAKEPTAPEPTESRPARKPRAKKTDGDAA
jgi:NADH-quinone oxidoreductase subunit C